MVTTIPPEPVAGDLRATALSAGAFHTCALSVTRVVLCWGRNDFGQLGIASDVPFVPEPLPMRTRLEFSAVDAGETHTCGVAAAQAFCWGSNEFGEIGDGASYRPGLPGPPTPARALLDESVLTVSAGARKTCATSAESTTCWGKGISGQLGNGDTSSHAVPQRVLLDPGDDTTLEAVATEGATHSCGITRGALYCWGSGHSGQLGIGPNAFSTRPERVVGPVSRLWCLVLISALGCTDPLLPGPTRRYTDVTTGGSHTCALDDEGIAYCWGRGLDGELGWGRRENSAEPVPPPVLGLHFRSISAGEAHTCGVQTDGRVSCWGWNGYYQLGRDDSGDALRPQLVTSSIRFDQVSAGSYHTCAVAIDARVYCWGFNRWGQIGNGTNDTAPTPTPVAGDLRALAVIAGGSHTCALSTDRIVWCWGANDVGQLGVGSSLVSIRVPVAVGRFDQVSAGRSHTCALDTFRRAYCWGSNADGELGNGVPFRAGLVGSSGPVQVLFIEEVTAVTAGHGNSCAIAAGGQAFCWGRNDVGQLGIGSLTSTTSPEAVNLFPRQSHSGDFLAFTKLEAGGTSHVCGLADDSVFCWGTGPHGELGNRRSFATQPQRVPD